MEIGGVFVFLEAWSFRLYLGASSCIYFLFLALDVFIFYGMYMLGGDIMFFISFIVSCFTCAILIIDLYYEVIHDICLLFSVL